MGSEIGAWHYAFAWFDQFSDTRKSRTPRIVLMREAVFLLKEDNFGIESLDSFEVPFGSVVVLVFIVMGTGGSEIVILVKGAVPPNECLLIGKVPKMEAQEGRSDGNRGKNSHGEDAFP